MGRTRPDRDRPRRAGATRPTDHPDGLPAEARDRMVGLLTAALADAWSAALAAGAAPADLAEIVAARRRAVESPPPTGSTA